VLFKDGTSTLTLTGGLSDYNISNFIANGAIDVQNASALGPSG